MAYSLTSNWKRFAAFVVDCLLLNVIITKPLESMMANNLPQSFTDLLNLDFQNLFLITFLVSSINLLYWVILEYKVQQTLGGLIFNIYAKSENNKLTLHKVFLRNLTKISLVLLIIDSLGIFLSRKKQRFTERLTKTITIENG
jgi:uncharacterized RDD family membrane protein YckC